MSERIILLIDDEDDIREVAQLSLEMVGGWRVLTAASAAEGLRIAAEMRPDAILLDVMMPEMDGPTAFQRLIGDERTRSIPVILLTAKAQPAERSRFMGLGVSAVIAKPFDPMTLPAEVAAALQWTR
jgi:CheY-like chemotaxis protein